ncbi:hypothetical protein [Marinomonas fungiae]|uniref:hypothetical protein n=1 Tax=Marinomonas fungiae TaxID=1137284 RepID=UPI003A906B74
MLIEELSTQALFENVEDEKQGNIRIAYLEELSKRALDHESVLQELCILISRNNKIGFHSGPPLGWFAADCLFLSNSYKVVRYLLLEISKWNDAARDDLLRHWAGRKSISEFKEKLNSEYGTYLS